MALLIIYKHYHCRPWALSSLSQLLKRSSHLMYLVNGRWIPAELILSGSCLEIKSEVARVRYRISELIGCDRSRQIVYRSVRPRIDLSTRYSITINVMFLKYWLGQNLGGSYLITHLQI